MDSNWKITKKFESKVIDIYFHRKNGLKFASKLWHRFVHCTVKNIAFNRIAKKLQNLSICFSSKDPPSVSNFKFFYRPQLEFSRYFIFILLRGLGIKNAIKYVIKIKSNFEPYLIYKNYKWLYKELKPKGQMNLQ